MKVIKITESDNTNRLHKKRGYYLNETDSKQIINELDDLFANGEMGDGLNIILHEMTEEEYENLPEFEGW